MLLVEPRSHAYAIEVLVDRASARGERAGRRERNWRQFCKIHRAPRPSRANARWNVSLHSIDGPQNRLAFRVLERELA